MEGTRVVRGPSWKYGNEDASEGYVGTVVNYRKASLFGSALSQLISPNKPSGTVIVAWDCGVIANYRIGHQGAFDLRIVDNSATGVKHPDFSCIQCCSGDITGIRWHCETCNASLCSSCFFKETHDRAHTQFKRYQTSSTPPVLFNLDFNNPRIEMKGIFDGARVKRGYDWNSGTEDHTEDGLEGVGQVIETGNPTLGMVNVKWSNGNTFPYRMGSEGKSELKLVCATTFGHYNPEHLPVLKSELLKDVTSFDGAINFAVGDAVTVNPEIDANRLKEMQESYGGWNKQMEGIIGKTGIVRRELAGHGILVLFDGFDCLWRMNPEALVRLFPFSVGQPVQIKEDPTTVANISQQYGNPTARDVVGETGIINYSNQNGQIEVILDDSEKKTKNILLDWDWVTIIAGDKSVNKGMAELKTKTVSVLVEAAASGQHNVVKKLLTSYPVPVDAQNNYGRTALHSACLHGHLQIIRWLLDRGADSEQQDEKGRRALHHAAKGCHPEVLTLLIKKGANLDVLDKKMLTPLQLAVGVGCLQSVRVLVKNGCNVNLQDSYGNSALNNAIIQEQHSYRDPKIVDTLASSEAIDLKLRNNRGHNPLLLSVAVGNVRAFKYLLCLPDGTGKELATEKDSPGNKFTALHMVCFKGEHKFAKIFLNHLKPFITADGRDMRELRCEGGKTPLLLAVYCGHHALVELLVEEGEVDVKATDEDIGTAVHIAAIRLEILKGEPKERTSPSIFKIHKELNESHPGPLECYPALSIMCYLIKKGCPWKRPYSEPYSRKANAIINNELIRGILESYSPSSEPIVDIDTDLANAMAGCVLCPQKVTVASIVEDCRHTVSVTCARCFSRLHKCLECGGNNKSYDKATYNSNNTPSPGLFPSWDTTWCYQKKQHNKNVRSMPNRFQDEIPSDEPHSKKALLSTSDVVLYNEFYEIFNDERGHYSTYDQQPPPSNHMMRIQNLAAGTLDYYNFPRITDEAAGASKISPNLYPASEISIPSNLIVGPSSYSNSFVISSDVDISLKEDSKTDPLTPIHNAATVYYRSPSSSQYVLESSALAEDDSISSSSNGNSKAMVVDQWRPLTNNSNNVTEQSKSYEQQLNQLTNLLIDKDYSSDGSPLNTEDWTRFASSSGQEINCTIRQGKKGKTEILDDGRGNSYGKQRTSTVNGDETWRCTKSQDNLKKTKCPATIIRSNDGVCRIGKCNHVHPQGSHRHGD